MSTAGSIQGMRLTIFGVLLCSCIQGGLSAGAGSYDVHNIHVLIKIYTFVLDASMTFDYVIIGLCSILVGARREAPDMLA